MFFSDAGLELQSSNLLLGLMKLLSPALFGSPKRWLKFKGIYNLQSTLGSCRKKDTAINIVLFFFSPDHFTYVTWVIVFLFLLQSQQQ